MTTAHHVVIAEDDEFVQQLIAACFQAEGVRVSLAASGRELMATLDNDVVDLVLLDLGLPDEDGLVLMRQIRARLTIPIVVLTARQERDDRISALEMGADDYLTKPCDPRELVLRVQNLLKRSGAGSSFNAYQEDQPLLLFAGLQLNVSARVLHDSSGKDVHLTRSEFNLLTALVKAANRVLSRAQLLDAISQDDSSPSERMIDVIVARLRRKLGTNPQEPQLIKTMVGVGYKFAARVEHGTGR